MLRQRSTYEPKHALPVSRSTERRSTFFVLLVMLLSSGFVVGTSASFDASNTDDASQFAMATLDRPTNLQGEMEGTAGAISWWGATGDDNVGAGYNVLWGDAGPPADSTGASPTCAGVTGYTKISDTSGFSYDDTGVNTRAEDPPGTPRPGRFACYMVETVYPYPPTAEPWVSQIGNPTKDIQIGFVAAGVAMTNGGTNFTMGPGDAIAIRFNQPVSTASGPAEGTTAATGSAPRICSINTNGSEAILLGAMGNHDTSCSAAETTLVGRLHPALDRIDRNVRFTVTWAWSDCAAVGQCRVLTGTLGAKVNPTAPQLPATGAHAAWTFTPDSTLLSATGGLAICTLNPTGGLCQPQTTGGW